MAVLKRLDGGGKSGDIKLVGPSAKSRNDDYGLWVHVPAGEKRELGDLRIENVFHPIIKTGDGLLTYRSLDTTAYGGDNIIIRGSNYHCEYNRTSGNTPTRPYSVCVREGDESIEECLARHNETVYDPSILSFTTHPEYPGVEIIACSHVDFCQVYLTHGKDSTLNPDGVIENIKMPWIKAEMSGVNSQGFVWSENMDAANNEIGTKHFYMRLDGYELALNANTWRDSVFGCEGADIADLGVLIKERKPRPESIPTEAVRTTNNQIVGFDPKCIVEECLAGGDHDHSQSEQDIDTSWIHEAESKDERVIDIQPPVSDKPYDSYKKPRVIKTEDLGEDVIQVKEDNSQPEWISEIGLNTLIKSEGSRGKLYYCTANVPTIGIGHALSKSEATSCKIRLNSGRVLDFRRRPLNDEEIKALLEHDLVRFNAAVFQEVKVSLTTYQFDALVHFSFNVGVQAFKDSTLLRKLNQGLYQEVPFQIRRWVKQPELAGRREVEVSMWKGHYHDDPVPVNDFSKVPLKNKIEKMAGSRAIWGLLLSALGLSGSVENGISIVDSVEKVAKGTKDVAEKAGEAVESVGSIASMFGITNENYTDFLFWSLMASLLAIAIGIGVALYARIDDMRTGRNK